MAPVLYFFLMNRKYDAPTITTIAASNATIHKGMLVSCKAKGVAESVGVGVSVGIIVAPVSVLLLDGIGVASVLGEVVTVCISLGTGVGVGAVVGVWAAAALTFIDVLADV